MNSIRHSVEEIKTELEKYNCTLISGNCTNLKSILKYKCEKEHINTKTYFNFLRAKYKCKFCNRNKINAKYTIDDVRKFFTEVGYELLSTEYMNTQQKLKYKCNENHINEVSLAKFLHRHHRCSICSGKKMATIDVIQTNFAEKECTLLTIPDKYDPREKLHFKCKKEHECYMTYQQWKNSIHKCPKCAIIETTNNSRYTYDEIKHILKQKGYELMMTENEYKSQIKNNAIDKIKFKCDNNHTNEMTFHSINQNNICSICTKKQKINY